MCKMTLYYSRTCSHKWLAITQPCGYTYSLANALIPLGFTTCPRFQNQQALAGINISCRQSNNAPNHSAQYPYAQHPHPHGSRGPSFNEASERQWAPPGMYCMVCDGSYERGAVDRDRVRVIEQIVDGWRCGSDSCGVGCGWDSEGTCCCAVM